MAHGEDSTVDAGFEPVPSGDFPPGMRAHVPLDGQVLAPVWIDGALGWLAVDTGAVRTMLHQDLVPEVRNGVGEVSLDFGNGIVLDHYEVMAQDLSEARRHVASRLAGVIGQDLFHRYYFGLDYANCLVHMAEGAPRGSPPAHLQGELHPLPYDLVQGLPIVTVTVAGRDLRLIADTGSGVTMFTRSSVPEAWLADGIAGYRWYTSQGSDPGTVIRVPEMEVAGVEVSGTWAVVVPDDHHLAQVFELLGIEVDGFLGFPVYRRFFVGIDGQGHRYEFYPYSDLAHVPTLEWDRVGVELTMVADSQEPVVDMVFCPSDACERVEVGQTLSMVDGVPTAGLSLDEVRLMLRGARGDIRTMVLDGVEIPVAIDRLLPPEPVSTP